MGDESKFFVNAQNSRKSNKLVRDKIPEIIKQSGKMPEVHVATENEYYARLKEKLSEEINEFILTESKEELADVLEVLYAISDLKGFDKSEVEIIRTKKAEERGKFKKRLILDNIK